MKKIDRPRLQVCGLADRQEGYWKDMNTTQDGCKKNKVDPVLGGLFLSEMARWVAAHWDELHSASELAAMAPAMHDCVASVRDCGVALAVMQNEVAHG